MFKNSLFLSCLATASVMGWTKYCSGGKDIMSSWSAVSLINPTIWKQDANSPRLPPPEMYKTNTNWDILIHRYQKNVIPKSETQILCVFFSNLHQYFVLIYLAVAFICFYNLQCTNVQFLAELL